jgi:hypothetical protein
MPGYAIRLSFSMTSTIRRGPSLAPTDPASLGEDRSIRIRIGAQALDSFVAGIEMKQSRHTWLFARLLKKGIKGRWC